MFTDDKLTHKITICRDMNGYIIGYTADIVFAFEPRLILTSLGFFGDRNDAARAVISYMNGDLENA